MKIERRPDRRSPYDETAARTGRQGMPREGDVARAIHHALSCHVESSETTGDPELDAIRLAILIEDVTGGVLSDSELDSQWLGDAQHVSTLVAEHEAEA